MFIKGGKSLILGSGTSLEEYHAIELNATVEVQDADVPMHLRLRSELRYGQDDLELVAYPFCLLYRNLIFARRIVIRLSL